MRREHDVGVDEDQHRRAVRGVGELLAGPRLAPPAVGQRRAVEQLHPRVVTGDPAHDVGGAVGRAVVEHQHPQVAHAGLRQHRPQARLDPRGLVAHGQQHRHRLGDRRRVGRWPAQPVQVPRGVHGAGDGERRRRAARPRGSGPRLPQRPDVGQHQQPEQHAADQRDRPGAEPEHVAQRRSRARSRPAARPAPSRRPAGAGRRGAARRRGRASSARRRAASRRSWSAGCRVRRAGRASGSAQVQCPSPTICGSRNTSQATSPKAPTSTTQRRVSRRAASSTG